MKRHKDTERQRKTKKDKERQRKRHKEQERARKSKIMVRLEKTIRKL